MDEDRDRTEAPRTLYVVTAEDYPEYRIEGIFSDREEARRHIDRAGPGGDRHIEAFTRDERSPGKWDPAPGPVGGTAPARRLIDQYAARAGVPTPIGEFRDRFDDARGLIVVECDGADGRPYRFTIDQWDHVTQEAPSGQ